MASNRDRMRAVMTRQAQQNDARRARDERAKLEIDKQVMEWETLVRPIVDGVVEDIDDEFTRLRGNTDALVVLPPDRVARIGVLSRVEIAHEFRFSRRDAYVLLLRHGGTLEFCRYIGGSESSQNRRLLGEIAMSDFSAHWFDEMLCGAIADARA